MPMRFNPPPGWPPAPPGWVPPPGWQPDPSWPDPPPGWNLWIEDTAAHRLKRPADPHGQMGNRGRRRRLPRLPAAIPDLITARPLPRQPGTQRNSSFLRGRARRAGPAMLAKAKRARLISGILAFVVAGLTMLTLAGLLISGIVGADETNPSWALFMSISPRRSGYSSRSWAASRRESAR